MIMVPTKVQPNFADNRLLQFLLVAYLGVWIDNNICERAVKPVTIGRKNWMFAGSERGGKAMAIAFTLIETAKLNGVDPQAWLTNVLSRIADHKALSR
jgi:hypothetical protein